VTEAIVVCSSIIPGRRKNVGEKGAPGKVSYGIMQNLYEGVVDFCQKSKVNYRHYYTFRNKFMAAECVKTRFIADVTDHF
jgi:hypothetical protein